MHMIRVKGQKIVRFNMLYHCTCKWTCKVCEYCTKYWIRIINLNSLQYFLKMQDSICWYRMICLQVLVELKVLMHCTIHKKLNLQTPQHHELHLCKQNTSPLCLLLFYLSPFTIPSLCYLVSSCYISSHLDFLFAWFELRISFLTQRDAIERLELLLDSVHAYQHDDYAIW